MDLNLNFNSPGIMGECRWQQAGLFQEAHMEDVEMTAQNGQKE